ncbi:hypothetical protein RJ639_013177 [Escallonia herrerae]|uniref:Uncharacterized protein n=1 Tax=Escallonia herrerae TaxID=1293975 RepID=A0AA88VJY1_9ASTE|nr:hypothetical protein RJ639_013177 [Escallonia herrerae]
MAGNHETQAALYVSITNIMKDGETSDEKAPLFSKASIHRVPQNLRKLKESAYTPRIVSIGPYHKHDERLKNMEDRKKSYTNSLLSRVKSKTGQTADAVIKEITKIILEKAADARSYYAAIHELHDDLRFAEMLLVDGCFILELLYKNADQPQNVVSILGNNLVLLDVRHDLLLLENQIPMFVLQTLFDFSLVQPYTLFDLIISFFGNMLNFKLKIRKVVMPETAAHILGLLHDCYLPCDTAALERLHTSQIIKHSAIDLDRAGVDFKEGKGRDQICVNFRTSWRFSCLRSCCDSWFFQLCVGKPCFQIPKLCLYGSTEPFLRNLIAFEQCSPSIPRHITSYAFLMDILINTKEDVEVLEKAGVLENHLGASEDATRLFNAICKEVVLGEFTFWKQWQDLEEYCNSYSSKNFASWTELKRYYFSSRWALISVIAAFILFSLQVIQTIYTVRSFH